MYINVIIDYEKKKKKEKACNTIWRAAEPAVMRKYSINAKSSSLLGTALGQGYKCSLDHWDTGE